MFPPLSSVSPHILLKTPDPQHSQFVQQALSSMSAYSEATTNMIYDRLASVTEAPLWTI